MGLDQGDGSVRFTRVMNAGNEDIGLEQNHAYLDTDLPGKPPSEVFRPYNLESRGIAQIAVDPRAIREFYVTYSDRVQDWPSADHNVNCYVHRVRWLGTPPCAGNSNRP